MRTTRRSRMGCSNMPMLSRCVGGLSLLIHAVMPVLSAAHHSRAEFGGDVQEFEGELTAIEWRNPHPSFELRRSEGTGDVWTIELYGSAGSLSRTGVDAELFEVGQRIRIAGRPSTRRDNLLLGTHALLPNGVEAVLSYELGPRWNDRYAGGRANDSFDEAMLEKAASENRGIFRTWSVPSIAEAVNAAQDVNLEFTDAAVAARSGWDPTDHPITRCEQPWMPHVMFHPTMWEFVDDGDTIMLKNALFDSFRTIHLDEPPNVEEVPRSRMGLSVGRWEGSTLVVETSRITAPALDQSGSLQSEAMTVTERFTLSEDQSRLDYELVMTDPVALSEPAVLRKHYLALGREYQPYICGAR